MTRRTFLAAVAVGPVLLGRSATAQPAGGVPRIGLLRPNEPANPLDRAFVGAFLTGLHEAGYENGRNIAVETRYARNDFNRLPALARELAALPLAAIVTANPYSTVAARAATTVVPIVVALDLETDPVASGWIASLKRPGATSPASFSIIRRWAGSSCSFSESVCPL